MFRCPSRGEGVRCAVFLYQKTDERSQFLIFQSSLHSLPYIKTLLFVLCDFGHYFLCKKIYPISVFWFFFFNSGNWASSFSFIHTTLFGELLPLRHTNVCQTVGSFCSLKQFELHRLPALPECHGLPFQGTVTPYHSQLSHGHFPLYHLLRASSWQHQRLQWKKAGSKTFANILNKETPAEVNSKAMLG